MQRKGVRYGAALAGIAALALACGSTREDAPEGCAVDPALAADCDALLESRAILAGTAALNWSVDAPLAAWDGVTVSGSPPRVTALELSGRGLTGSIPPRLANLTALTRLHLKDNPLTGCVPNALWSVAERDLGYLGLTSCVRPSRMPGWQPVGAGTWCLSDHGRFDSGPSLVIDVGPGREIRWASTIYATPIPDDEGRVTGSLLFQLVDVETGYEFAYDAYTAARATPDDLLLSREGGEAVTAFVERITRSARIEPIWCGSAP